MTRTGSHQTPTFVGRENEKLLGHYGLLSSIVVRTRMELSERGRTYIGIDDTRRKMG